MSSLIEDETRLREVIASGGDALVLFYASWCGHSRSFLPVFEKHACGDSCFRVLTDKVDGVEDIYDISFVPTVIFFHKGRLHVRLDGVAGEGLNEKMLLGLMATCGLRAGEGNEQ